MVVRAEFPRDRSGLLACVWAEVIDREQFVDYSQHYRWTVEHAGGIVLVPGARPSQTVLRGGPGPHAMGLMGWPADEQIRRTWYDGEQTICSRSSALGRSGDEKLRLGNSLERWALLFRSTSYAGGRLDGRYLAFLESITHLRPRLHIYCSRMSGSVLDGEDIVQEALFS